MLLHAAQGFRGRVYDLDTGREVLAVEWIDTDVGRLKAARVATDGKLIRDINGDVETYTARGRFKIVHREMKSNGKILAASADNCSRCHSWLVLPGHELCPRCNAADKGIKELCARLLRTPILDCKCQEKGCSRLARYQVGDEVQASPHRPRGDRLAYTRAMTVRQRFYCDFHYRPPRLLDPKGEVVKEFADQDKYGL